MVVLHASRGLAFIPGSQPPHLHLDLLGCGREVSHHEPVPRGWVRDVDRGVAQKHGAQQCPDVEGGLAQGVISEASVQRVDDRRGAIAEMPGRDQVKGQGQDFSQAWVLGTEHWVPTP